MINSCDTSPSSANVSTNNNNNSNQSSRSSSFSYNCTPWVSEITQPGSRIELYNNLADLPLLSTNAKATTLSFGCRFYGGDANTLDRQRALSGHVTTLEATIWDERDETKDYVGRTMELRDGVVRDEGGLRIGVVQRRVQEMFDEHADVSAIKLTTV